MLRLTLVVWLLLGLPSLAAEPPVYGTYRFVEKVLLTPERGTNVKRCRRFVDSPSVALLWGNEHQQEFDDAVASINAALVPTRVSLRTTLPTSADVQIKCFFASGPADYARIRQANWLQTPPRDWVWDMNWDASSRIGKGYVLMNIQGCDPATVRYRTTRALLGALGFYGWCPEVTNSIFSGQRQVLTPIDQQLIAFFYGHVQPDAKDWELRKAVDQFWNK